MGYKESFAKLTYTIDGHDFSTLESFFEEIDRVLLLGNTWGKNLDALNDILRGGFGTPQGGFILCWRHADISRERLGYPETIRQLKRQLIMCHPSNQISMKEKLEQAKQEVGPTVFDWLVEIIQTHGPGGEEEESGVELRLA